MNAVPSMGNRQIGRLGVSPCRIPSAFTFFPASSLEGNLVPRKRAKKQHQRRRTPRKQTRQFCEHVESTERRCSMPHLCWALQTSCFFWENGGSLQITVCLFYKKKRAAQAQAMFKPASVLLHEGTKKNARSNCPKVTTQATTQAWELTIAFCGF